MFDFGALKDKPQQRIGDASYPLTSSRLSEETVRVV
jgi:hypothetical protein